MKKINFILSLTAAVLLSASLVFASGDTQKIWDELLKITEKCTDNVSYNMVTKSKVNNKEVSTKMAFYFKDVKNYRVDTEVEKQKTTMVLTDKEAWVYLSAQNVITIMDHAAVQSIDIREALEKQKENADVSEGKDGANITYTITERETKNKTVFTVDAKAGIYSKMQVYNAKNELVTEAEYSGWKFGAIGADVFAKPAGAKEMKMPSQAKPEGK
jgi:outer membrane lipoprotein-sorting protein